MVLILSSAFVFAIAKIRFISLIYNFLHIILLKKIDKIRDKGADFVIELKANQRSLRYGLEDSIKTATPTDIYKEGPYFEKTSCFSCMYVTYKLLLFYKS